MGRGGMAASGLMVQSGVKLDTLTADIKISITAAGHSVTAHRFRRCPHGVSYEGQIW